MRLVLDTNVVISGLLWDGAPRQVLGACRGSGIQAFTSQPLLAELKDALSRPKFAKKISRTLFSVDQILNRYTVLAETVMPVIVPHIAPDPDDDVVIGTALAARADWIVTGDKGLLSVKEYKGGRIVSVLGALRTLGPSE